MPPRLAPSTAEDNVPVSNEAFLRLQALVETLSAKAEATLTTQRERNNQQEILNRHLEVAWAQSETQRIAQETDARKRITDLEGQLEKTNRDLARQNHNSSSRAVETKISLPTEFRGHEDNLNDFLTLVQFNFDINPSKFPSGEIKVTYASSFLCGAALRWLQPSLKDRPKPDWLLNFDLWCTELRRNYGDSDEQGTAQKELKLLTQTGSTASYAASFRQYASTLHLDSSAQQIFFYDGLKENVKDELNKKDEFNNINDLIAAAIYIDRRIAKRKTEKELLAKKNGILIKDNRYHSSDTPARTTSTLVKETTKTSSAPTSTSSPPPTNRLPSGKLDGAEKQRRRDNNLCLYCGGEGHIADDCPVKAAKVSPPGKA